MTIELCRTVSEFRASCERVRQNGGVLGLVPTMGALHAGHTALIAEAVRRATEVAVTIFVNPTQFGPTEDLARYPRTFERDLELCEAFGARTVFAPSVHEMYPPDERTRVSVKGIAAHLCGASRPSHFDGVATIVTKLFAVAGPCTAVFGRKDYQQLKLIQRMTRDLLLPVAIVDHPTIRETDGLAMSSRNAYLSAEQRASASSIPRALAAAVSRFQAGERSAGALKRLVSSALDQAGLRIDYVALADADDVTPKGDAQQVGERVLLAIAAFAGNTRLIDNVVLGEDATPLAEEGRS